MARFDKLEFGSEQPRRKPSKPSESKKKDESHWFNLATTNRSNGHYENALRYYSRALELDKGLVAAWVGQVRMLVQLDELTQAELWSSKAIELFPGDGDLLAGQAQANYRIGNAKKARELIDGALRQPGQSAYRWLVRGEVTIGNKQQADSHCFDKAQEIDTDWQVPVDAALIYLYHRVPSQALRRAATAVEKAPDAYYAWYVHGLCQLKVGFDSSARSSFERCLELCPRHADAQARLSEIEQPQWPFLNAIRRLIGRN